jgi:hypothetical protein
VPLTGVLPSGKSSYIDICRGAQWRPLGFARRPSKPSRSGPVAPPGDVLGHVLGVLAHNDSVGEACLRSRGSKLSLSRSSSLVEAAARPETKLYRTVCIWWKESEFLIVIGATTGKVDVNNTGMKHVKEVLAGTDAVNFKSTINMTSASWTEA